MPLKTKSARERKYLKRKFQLAKFRLAVRTQHVPLRKFSLNLQHIFAHSQRWQVQKPLTNSYTACCGAFFASTRCDFQHYSTCTVKNFFANPSYPCAWQPWWAKDYPFSTFNLAASIWPLFLQVLCPTLTARRADAKCVVQLVCSHVL